MTLSQYLLTVSSTIWIHLMVMFKRNQAQLLEFVRWHMDGFRTQSLVSFVSTIALWCEFSWKMPLKKKSPGKLTTMSPNEFLWEVHAFRPTSPNCVFSCHSRHALCRFASFASGMSLGSTWITPTLACDAVVRGDVVHQVLSEVLVESNCTVGSITW